MLKRPAAKKLAMKVRSSRITKYRRHTGAALGVKEWWASLLPGMVIGILFADEDLWHERLLLWPTDRAKCHWYCLTPDDDRYVEGLLCGGGDDEPIAGFICSDQGDAPDFSSGRFYRFGGYPGVAGFAELIRSAKGMVEATGVEVVAPTALLTVEGKRVSAKAFFDAQASERPSKKAGKEKDKDKGKKNEEPVESEEAQSEEDALPMVRTADFGDECWITLEAAGDLKLGDVVTMKTGDVALGNRGIHKAGELYVAVGLVKDEEAPQVQRASARGLRERLGLGAPTMHTTLVVPPGGGGASRAAKPADAAADVPNTALAATSPKPGRGAQDEAGEAAAAEDERTLWIDIDEHSEIWKPWRKVVRESFTRSWGKEWDLEGPPSCLEVMRHFDRNGGDPRLWMQLFMTDKGLKRGDRLYHELNTLIDALYYAGSVDCLNVGGLVCLEILARRVETITEALRDGVDRASWGTAGYLAGRRQALDCVSPSLRSWASSQVQADRRVQEMRMRGRAPGGYGGGGGEGEGEEGDGAPAAAGADPAGGPKGGGRRGKGGGRGGK